MLPRSQRLSVEQFNAVMEKGRAAHAPLFVVRHWKSPEHTRISATVSKKILKTAVARNALRRRIYEAVSPFMAELPDGTHGIVFGKSGAEVLDTAAMSSEIRNLFVKAGLLK